MINLKRLYREAWLHVFKGRSCKWYPKVTQEMSRAGLTWRLFSDDERKWFTWREVCDFCGGNCGQCGITGRVGNVGFSMDRMVDKLHHRI